MSYLKRQMIPKNWPVKRKGLTYVVRPNFNTHNGIPILIILRDMLNMAQNRKEVKRALYSKHILLNGKTVRDERNSALLFDIITIVPSKKFYRIELSEGGKFQIEEIKKDEANKKIAKVVNKKILKGKRTQLNLSDGRNFISNLKCNINDSVLINLEKGEIEKCLPLKEKAKVIVFAGKHSGEKGSIEKLDLEKKMAKVNEGKKIVNILIKQLIAVG